MKQLIYWPLVFLLIIFLADCRTTKQINKVIAPKDTTIVKNTGQSAEDSVAVIRHTVDSLHSNYIDFRTFNAKIKVEYQDSKGKQPDITAVVRIIKDSAIWVSLSATFLNFEVYRVLISKDSVILLNKQDKEVQYRSLDYLQDVTEIPFDFNTLQDLLVGNPVYFDSNVVAYRRIDDKILMSVAGKFFKHLVTLSAKDYTVLHSKLDDVDINRNRTADITYGGYETNSGLHFSTYREITVSEKNRLDIQLTFKQYEFNKELSVNFNVPKNYKRK